MSRSKKLPIVKDVGHMKYLYHKIIRRTYKAKIKYWVKYSLWEETLPSPKELVNDYNYRDYWVDCKNTPYEQKATRK